MCQTWPCEVYRALSRRDFFPMFNSSSKFRSKLWRSSRRLFRLVWVWLTWPVLVLQNMAVQLARTLKSWWRTRNFRQFLAGLSVIVVACAAPYIGIAAANLV